MDIRIRCAGILIKNDSILLVEHREASGEKYWALPGGGLEEGENIEECFHREMAEETGFDVKIKKLVSVREFLDTPKNKTNIEFYFLCEEAGPARGKARTNSEMYQLQSIRFMKISDLSKIPVFPGEFSNSEWVRAFLHNVASFPAFLKGEKSQKVASLLQGPPPIPSDLKSKFPNFFKTPPAFLSPENSHSNNGPLVAEAENGKKIVIRKVEMEDGKNWLELNRELHRLCKSRLGHPLYPGLFGNAENHPFSINEKEGFVVQEFSREHRLDVIHDLRDYDIYHLGKYCGEVQKVLDLIPSEMRGKFHGSHPLSMPLAERLMIIQERLEPPELCRSFKGNPAFSEYAPMPVEFAEWLCEETGKTLHSLIALGALGFPNTLIDRDLNIRNSTIVLNKKGLATLKSIFDPDFCQGAAADSLRNPGLSFASTTPRMSLNDILREDPNTFGSPRWMLFLRGFLEFYPLSHDEIMAIPLLEKLEILLFRLFESHPRFLVPPEYIGRFRSFTKTLLARIDNINWHYRLLPFCGGRFVAAFPDKLPREFEPELAPFQISPVKEKTLVLLQSVLKKREKLIPRPKKGRQSYNLDESWTLIAEPSTTRNKNVTVCEGFPFPVAKTTVPITKFNLPRSWQWTAYYHGESLKQGFREELETCLRRSFPDFQMKVHPRESLARLQQISSSLDEDRRGIVAILDPFRYKGDALYIGMYLRMLRECNPSTDFAVISRNEGIVRLFDSDFVCGLAELPERLLAAVVPIPIDDQWREARCLIPPLLARTNLVLIPQRDIVIQKQERNRTIEVFFTPNPDLMLEHTNISTYTWQGLHRLLPRPISLNSTLHFLREIPPHMLFSSSRPIFINPRTSNPLKDLSPMFCEKLVQKVLELFPGKDQQILINAGDPSKDDDLDFAREVTNRVKNNDNVILWKGQTMAETVNMLSAVRCVITADTSIAHAAGYQGVPSLVIWNTRRWDVYSPKDMVHQSPAGFSCYPPNVFDVTVTFDQNGLHDSIREDIERVGTALSLMKDLFTTGKYFIWKKRSPEGLEELIWETENLAEFGFSAFDQSQNVDFPAFKRKLSKLAILGESVAKNLSNKARDFLGQLAPPLNMQWVFPRMSNPHLTGWSDSRRQNLFALDLWRFSPLFKIVRFSRSERP